jgi:sugar O-acyltransferase (sialic acid O-acetyltransferase NeuD family)
MGPANLVVFGASNIVSDIFDNALANGVTPTRVVLHLEEQCGERDLPLAARVAALAPGHAPPAILQFAEFRPGPGEIYLLGPTTPTREALAREVQARWGLKFCTLVHPTAYVSPLATLGDGVFVGANSVIGPGARIADHVFVNRGVTIGHDTWIDAFSRVQPGSHLGGLSRIGRGVTIAIGATLVERLRVGDGAVIGAGSVVLGDVPANVMVAGTPASVRRPA